MKKVYCSNCKKLSEVKVDFYCLKNIPKSKLICSECFCEIDINSKNNLQMTRQDKIELKLYQLKEEDLHRENIQLSKRYNLKSRLEVDNKKKEDIYNETKDGFSLGGYYLKRNQLTGDLFLSPFSYGDKKEYQRHSNKRLRKNKLFDANGSSYKKLYDIEWIII